MRSPTCLAAVFLVLASPLFSTRSAHAETAPQETFPEHWDPFLDELQQRTFGYFWDLTDPQRGLTPDRWPTRSFCSIAAVGFALTSYPIGVERGFVTREQAALRVLATLRFFHDAPQGPEPSGRTGYQGFFYHFLEMESGHRYREVELSTIDTALFLAGALFCRSYFDGLGEAEQAIRELADTLYHRARWDWAQPHSPAIVGGWKPETGFLKYEYRGYNEAMILYILALGSPTHTVGPEAWTEYTKSYRWGNFHGYDHLNFGPLFGHQYSHVWIDFRGIQDAAMRARALDYFENSRRATCAQRAYAMANPDNWDGYGNDVWGLTASDGPIRGEIEVRGKMREFHAYRARGASLGPNFDDGTIAPTAMGGSLPFAPEIAVPALKALRDRYGEHLYGQYGFFDALNPTFQFDGLPLQHGRVVPGHGWFDTDYIGIDQGPIVAMIENYRSGLIWRYMRAVPYIAAGLRRAGFTGGWLADKE